MTRSSVLNAAVALVAPYEREARRGRVVGDSDPRYPATITTRPTTISTDAQDSRHPNESPRIGMAATAPMNGAVAKNAASRAAPR